MSFVVPGLASYFGGKGGDGTYQKIINLIPPHKQLIIPFAGHCGITRNIKKCEKTYLNDFDYRVADAWVDYYLNELFGKWFITNLDFRIFFSFLENEPFFDHQETVIYNDPTYPMGTRKSNHTYNCELTDKDHEELLECCLSFEHSHVLISTYDNKMYRDALKGWNKKSFRSQTRKGVAIETVYFNYDPPTILHDYRYFGETYKKREQFKLKKDRLLDKFNRMTPVERNYYAMALKKRFQDNF